MFIKEKFKYCTIALLGLNSMLCSAEIVNLASSATVTATGSYLDNVPENAIDSNVDTYWSSGGMAQQWIEIDLGKKQDITEIQLLAEQTPAGKTSHNIYIDNEYIYNWSGETTGGQLLTYVLPQVVNGQTIKVETVVSPSWVAWSEVTILGHGEGGSIKPVPVIPTPTPTPVPGAGYQANVATLAANFDISAPVVEYKTGGEQSFYSVNFIYNGTASDGKSLWKLGEFSQINTAVPLDTVSVHLSDAIKPLVLTVDSIIADGQDYKVIFEYMGGNSEFVWKAVDISLN